MRNSETVPDRIFVDVLYQVDDQLYYETRSPRPEWGNTERLQWINGERMGGSRYGREFIGVIRRGSQDGLQFIGAIEAIGVQVIEANDPRLVGLCYGQPRVRLAT